MIVPNVDGKYAKKDGSVKVTVSRKSIEIEITPVKDEFTIIDEDSPKKRGGGKNTDEKMDKVMDVINRTSKILMG